MEGTINDKSLIKILIYCVIVGFISTIFVFNSMISLLIVLIMDLILLYFALKNKYDVFLVLYMVFLALSFETSSYFETTSLQFYGFKNTNFMGISNNLIIIIVVFIKMMLSYKVLNVKNKKTSISKLTFGFILLFIIASLFGLFMLISNDNGSYAGGEYFSIYVNELYYFVFTIMVVLFCYYSIVTSRDKNKTILLYKTSITALLLSLCITPFLTYIVGFKGGYGGYLMFPLSKFLIPFIILIPLYVKTKYKYLIYILWFVGNVFPILFFEAGTGKELLFLMISFMLFLLIKYYRFLHNKSLIIVPIVILFIMSFFILNYLSLQETRLGDKMNQIDSMISIWKPNWLKNMPLSPKIRIYELKSIMIEYKQKPYLMLFGKGIGGSFKDNCSFFFTISEDLRGGAFSEQEFQLNYFYRVHESFFRLLLNNGIIGLVFLIYILYKGLFKHFNIWTIVGLAWMVFYYNTTPTLSVIGILCLYIGFTKNVRKTENSLVIDDGVNSLCLNEMPSLDTSTSLKQAEIITENNNKIQSDDLKESDSVDKLAEDKNRQWEIKSGKTDLIWAIAGTALNVLMGVIVLPIMLIKLTDLDMGVWYVLAAIQSFIYLLDLGFSPTFTRNVTYAFSGVKNIVKDSLDDSKGDGKPNFELLSAIYLTGRKVYKILSLIAFGLLITGGLIYYISILPSNNKMYYITFGVFCIAMLINIYYTYIPAYMKGIGAMKESYQAYVVSRITYIIIAFALLLLNVGLLGVVIALLVSGLLLRLVSSYLLNKYNRANNIKTNDCGEYKVKNVFSEMLFNTKKEALITVSNFITSQMATFFCTSYFGLMTSSKYGLTLQILNVLSSLCFIYFTLIMPQISQSRIDNDKEKTKKLFCKSYFFLVLGFIFGIVVIAFFGPFILDVIGSNTKLLPKYLVVLFGLYLFLEKTYHICASYISTSNKLPYTIPYIVSAGIILILYAIIPKVFNVGVISFALICIGVQCCYNAWRWQIYVSKELEINPIKFVTLGLRYWILDFSKILKKNK